jgi:hypothetical protein
VVPLPTEIDDEYLSSSYEGRQPADLPSRLAYFTHSLGLSAIADKAQKLAKKHTEQGSINYSAQELGTIVDIHTELDRYHEQLPAHLQLGSDYSGVNRSNCFQLQGNALRARLDPTSSFGLRLLTSCRIIYVKIWILRPVLLAEVRRATETISSHSLPDKATASKELEQRLREDVGRLCVLAAHDVLEELHRSLSGVRRTSAWHALSCKRYCHYFPCILGSNCSIIVSCIHCRLRSYCGYS